MPERGVMGVNSPVTPGYGSGPKLRVKLTLPPWIRTLHIFVRTPEEPMEHQGDIYRFPDPSQPLKASLACPCETMGGPNG